MLRNILTIGGWTFASRILGFARDMLIAAVLGASPMADAFFLALRLPNMFRRLFGEGAFNAAFVPAFTAALTLDGPAKARALAARMSTLMALWLSLLVVVGMIFMPQIMTVLTPGLVDEPLRFGLVVELSRITFPYLLFICLTALVSGVLNAADKFALAAGAPLLFNLCAIVSLFALTPFVATPAHALACLEIGAVCPAVTSEEAGMQLPPLKKAENKRAEQQQAPQQAETPQKKTILDRALDSLQEAVESSPEEVTPEVKQKRKRLTRSVILVYAAIAAIMLIAALVIKGLVK